MIAAKGFAILPVGWEHLWSEILLAPYSPPRAGPRAWPLDKVTRASDKKRRSLRRCTRSLNFVWGFRIQTGQCKDPVIALLLARPRNKLGKKLKKNIRRWSSQVGQIV